MKTYIGTREPDGTASVCVEGDGPRRPLHHRVRHSPTGFEWGYGGSGPADLALSILTDLAGKEAANHLYHEFKWTVIASLPSCTDCTAHAGPCWTLTSEEIISTLDDLIPGWSHYATHHEPYTTIFEDAEHPPPTTDEPVACPSCLRDFAPEDHNGDTEQCRRCLALVQSPPG